MTGLVRICGAMLIVVLLNGCAAQHYTQTASLVRGNQSPRILLLPLDVELSELSASGMTTVNADWTEAAAIHLNEAVRKELAGITVKPVLYEAPDDLAPEATLVHELNALHGTVGNSISIHQYVGQFRLPTKQGRLDWSMGPAVQALRTRYNADYALFFHVRDSYSGPDRVAVIVIAALFGVAVPGGTQVGYASLVDLQTGNVVWFNRLARGEGDLRTPAPALETAKLLLTGMPK